MSARPELLHLLTAAKESPGDAATRLVLADWLEENGRPVDRRRAAYLRLEVSLAGRSAGSAEEDEDEFILLDEERQWHAQSLIEPAYLPNGYVEVRDGFGGVSVSLRDFLDGPLLGLLGAEAWGWVEGVTLRPPATVTEALWECPLLDGLVRLDAWMLGLTQREVHDLTRSPFLGSLRRLGLASNAVGDDGVAALNRWRRPLTHLGLSENLLSPVAGDILADSRLLDGLESLDLAFNTDLRDRGVRSLARGNAPRLRRLRLQRVGMTEVGLVALTAGPLLRGVRHLDLKGNWLGDAGVDALVNATTLRELREIELHATGLSAAGAEALLSAPGLTGVTRFHLGNNALDEAEERALTERHGPRADFDTGQPY